MQKNTKILQQPMCPRCDEPVQVREHKKITEKELKRPFYYSRWYNCTNKDCKTTLIMPKEFKVWNHNKAAQQLKINEELAAQHEHLRSI